jgi:dihydrofolate reductase
VVNGRGDVLAKVAHRLQVDGARRRRQAVTLGVEPGLERVGGFEEFQLPAVGPTRTGLTRSRWGRNDPFVPGPGALAYLADLPNAELHTFASGHFLLEDTSPDPPARRVVRRPHLGSVTGTAEIPSRSCRFRHGSFVVAMKAPDDGGTRMNRRTETGGRRVVVSEFVTLDGYMVGPHEDMSWVAVGFDPQMQDDLAEDFSGAFDLFVFGRVTYDIFADYWPHAVPYDEGDELKPAEGKEDARIIRALNERSKLVFSTTLEHAKWENTRVVAGGVEGEIRRLKQEAGGAIAIHGSASIVAALSHADLIDEYRLYVHPVLLGDGKRLLPGGNECQDFELTKLTRYANGVIATTYQRKNGADR